MPEDQKTSTAAPVEASYDVSERREKAMSPNEAAKPSVGEEKRPKPAPSRAGEGEV